MTNQQVINALVSPEAKIRKYVQYSGISGPDGDVHPGVCANINEAIGALRDGSVTPGRVASGLKKLAEYVEAIGLSRGDGLLPTYLFDLKFIANQIR